MAYVKNNWVDREGTTRYFETVDSDGAKIFTPDYTQVTELGTPVNADNMNHIEEGIEAGSFTKFDLNTTYVLNDLVTVIEDASPVIYKSLQDNNIGNALSNSAYWEKISLGGGGGLEIGDIGFTQMAIDESKGKRRVLNGQVIIQDQYVEFTKKVKSAVALYPSLACTEAEWQTEVTMNTFGLCGKFVIDDEGGTIRLPKYPNYFIAGLANIAPVVGNGIAPVFSDGTNERVLNCYQYGASWGLRPTNGKVGSASTVQNGVVNVAYGFSTDPTKSGIEAQINEKQIVGTYFIQVATGAETEDNIINEIELNNPFSLLDYKYSEYELNNISWLRSNGQYNSKAVYPAVYDLLLKIYNGTETKAGVSVKLSTGSYTDYDFVLNTADETFRLPIKVKANYFENIAPVVGNGMAIGLTDGTQYLSLYNNISYGLATGTPFGANIGELMTGAGSNNKAYGVTSDPTKSGIEAKLTNADLYLYFYVGETVQNANLINAGRIEEKLSNLMEKLTNYLSKDNKEEITGWGMPDYTSEVTKAKNTAYVETTNGWIVAYGNQNSKNFCPVSLDVSTDGITYKNVYYTQCGELNDGQTLFVPIPKGVYYKVGGTTANSWVKYFKCIGE